MTDKPKTKLQTLANSEGLTVMDLLREAVADSVCPGICMRPDCDYTCEIEPDQDRGWCEVCGAGTVKSALMLAEII